MKDISIHQHYVPQGYELVIKRSEASEGSYMCLLQETARKHNQGLKTILDNINDYISSIGGTYISLLKAPEKDPSYFVAELELHNEDGIVLSWSDIIFKW